ncbi:MAG: hypothetical protein FWC34_01020 [Bacteroidetes bacterium]|nr:hypothetical protein [Bacteroidota bacterium]
MDKLTILGILKSKPELKGKTRGIDFPRDLEFSVNNRILKIKMIQAGVIGNMQTDASAFEGWAICLLAFLDDLIDKIELHWDKPEFNKNDKIKIQHYNRFLYRVWMFYKTYHALFAKSQRKPIFEFENLIINHPNQEASESSTSKGEHKLEVDYVKNHESKYDILARQLPVGIFKSEISEKYAVMPANSKAQIDIWAIKDSTLKIFELKTPTNYKVGIISELMFYANIMSDVKNAVIKFPPSAAVCNYRSFNELYKRVKEKSLEKIEAIMLADNLHPLISCKKKDILKILNSNISGIKYSHERYSDK